MDNTTRLWWVVVGGRIKPVEGYVDSEGFLHSGNGLEARLHFPLTFFETKAEATIARSIIFPYDEQPTKRFRKGRK